MSIENSIELTWRCKNEVGNKFGRLTVLSAASKGEKGKINWLCRCECGNVKIVPGRYLRKGRVRSCGCLRAEEATKVLVGNRLGRNSIRDGRSSFPEYRPWRSMISRCRNKKATDFHLYGGRGVKVCERWKDFLLFLDDVGKRPSKAHSLDRIDVDGDYEPGNVRWATWAEQASNRRTP